MNEIRTRLCKYAGFYKLAEFNPGMVVFEVIFSFFLPSASMSLRYTSTGHFYFSHVSPD